MALVLTRRPGETICIGDNVRVTVLGTKGSHVRIAVEAPKHVAVDREELAIRKLRERIAEQHTPPEAA